eukprot:COSAG02_NODE_421_length_22605_cov_158.841198_18_plen_91_part_00
MQGATRVLVVPDGAWCVALGRLDRHQAGTAAAETVVLTTAMPSIASAHRWILAQLLLAVGAPLPTSATVHEDTFRRLQLVRKSPTSDRKQ